MISFCFTIRFVTSHIRTRICEVDSVKPRSLTSRHIMLDAYGCPSSFIVPVRLSDLPTLVPALPHMVTGTQAQRATQLCPQVPPCRLSIELYVHVSLVASTGLMSAVHTMVVRGSLVDSTGCLYPSIPCCPSMLYPSHPIFLGSVQRHGPDSHFPHNQDLIPRLSGPSALSGLRPPLSP